MQTTRVCTSSSKCASTSPTPIEHSLPVENTVVIGRPRPMKASRKAAAMKPLCASTATPARPEQG